MSIFFKILIYFLSLSLLISLVTYIYLLWKGNSETLYISTFHPNSLNLKQKVFLWLVGIGGFVVLYKGIEMLLFWMPNSWGNYNEDGDWETLKTSLSIIIGAATWLFLFEILNKLIKNSYLAKAWEFKSREIEVILNSLSSLDLLVKIKKGYEAGLKKLELQHQEAQNKKIPDQRLRLDESIKGLEEEIYLELIFLVDQQINKFSKK